MMKMSRGMMVCAAGAVALVGMFGLAEAGKEGAVNESTGKTIAPVFDMSAVDFGEIGAAMTKAMTPDEHHEKLAYFVGEWDASSKIWMGGHDGSEPSVAKGVSKVKWVLGGRFLMSETKGEFMGQPSESIEMIGYDVHAGRYVTTTMSTMSTAMNRAEGLALPDGETIVYYGKMDEPGLVRGRTIKIAIRMKGEDTWVMDVYDLAIGEENNLVVETTFTRR